MKIQNSTLTLDVESNRRLQVGLTVFRILTSVLYVENNQMTFFRILTLILHVDNQTTSSELDEVFRILTLIFNVEDDEPGSTHLTCLVLVVVSFGRW